MRRLLLAAALAAALPCAAAPVAAADGGWCGSGEVAGNRLPDALTGPQLRVVYAYPSDGADGFATQAPRIADDVAKVDAWWRSQDPARTPRFDLYAFPGCTALDLGSVRLPATSDALRPGDTRYGLIAAGFPPVDPSVKLVVYYDGPVADPNLCGTGGGGEESGAGSLAVLYLASACMTSTGARAAILAHELTHELGALPPGAPYPHTCPGGSAHVCDTDRDLLYPYLDYDSIDALVLDAGRDDYYRHGQSWFDVADSPWLRHLDAPQQPLALTIVGDGAVAAAAPGLDCPQSCTTLWDAGSRVVLTATPAAGSRFVGWRGACTGDVFCGPTVAAPTAVEAVFGPARVRLAVRVSGRGSIAGGGVSCPRRCAASVAAAEPLSLRARPAKGARFLGWSGACRGAKPVCRLVPQAAVGARARFTR